MLEEYTELLKDIEQKLKLDRETQFQIHSEKSRDHILSRIYDTLPLFYSLYGGDLENSISVWFNEDPSHPRYGMPGILIWGHLFIGLSKTSDQFRLYLGSWEDQKSYTNDFKVESGILCLPHLEDKEQYRLEVEQKFLEQVNSCISLIEASPRSFVNWTHGI